MTDEHKDDEIEAGAVDDEGAAEPDASPDEDTAEPTPEDGDEANPGA